MMNYFALCHFTSDMSSRCVIGSGDCGDTYSFRHVLSPTNEVQQFIVSSIILILLPARKFKTLPQLNALLGLVLMHLLVRDCLVHLLVRDCLVHLLVRDCLVHLLLSGAPPSERLSGAPPSERLSGEPSQISWASYEKCCKDQ